MQTMNKPSINTMTVSV